MRCAIYARYSSDLQREASIDDQIRKCREFAVGKGWTVLDCYIRSDNAISGAALAPRDALNRLIADATAKPQPFDRILVDDTSRLARNVADALKMTERLEFYDVGVVFVSQGIDTLEKTARQLLTLHGMMDEQFLVGLADKVHRGQEGRVLKGLQPGGKCFGYINVPIEDPTRQGKYGRPAVAGVELRVHPEQAHVVRRIFQMYADGFGLAQIAKTLNEERVPAPQPPRTRVMQAWCPSSIREMLRNERYRGVHVWNRTEKVRNPETGRKVSKDRPKGDWMRVEVPEWRIVSEELWNAAHARIADANRRFGAKRLGGLNRTERSRSYLFSGLLVCGQCGSRIVIISGQGKRGYVRYGCPSHRYRGVCRNALTIRQDRLESQLVTALEQRILKPQFIDYTLQRFHDELQKRLAEIQRQATGLDDLRRERQQLQAKVDRLAEAIAEAGHSPAILGKLASFEAQIAELDRRMDACKPRDLSAAVGEVRGFVYKNVMQLRKLLHDDAEKSKPILARHIGQLILNPKETPEGPVYEVSGELDLLPAGGDVMQVVARDGIEPPTPAFSGLASAMII
jgi:site-specific DNA recombinase